jgi:hypothetical protein
MEKINNEILNDSLYKKIIFLTIVIILLYLIGGVSGFFLWFIFPVQKINGLSYLRTNDLIFYYTIINFVDIIVLMTLTKYIYFKNIKTKSPIRDCIGLGIYAVIFSWGIDIIVYIFVRKTLPTLGEYFFGKNQPEIGIAWLTGFLAAITIGVLEKRKSQKSLLNNFFIWILILSFLSILLTVAGIKFFDIKP